MVVSPDLPPITDLGLPFAQTTEMCIAKGLAQIVATVGPSNRIRSSYDIDAGPGIVAELRMKDGHNTNDEQQLIPDAVTIRIGDASKSRTIRAAIETEQTGDTDEEEYPRSVTVAQITDKREKMLKTGARVATSITFGRKYNRQFANEPGTASQQVQEETHVMIPTSEAPKFGEDTLTIPIEDDFGDYSHDVEPNLVIFEQRDNGSWTKSYAYAEDDGHTRKLRQSSEISVYVNQGHPDVLVRDAPVTEAELQEIQTTLAAAGNLGSVDNSLADLLDREIEYDRDEADRLTPRSAPQVPDYRYELYGEADERGDDREE